MKRYYSLKGRIQFKDLFFNGDIYKGKGIRIFVLNIENSDSLNSHYRVNSGKQLKIGISINKRYGKANKRNVAKRRIRAMCSELLKEMESGYNIIIRPEPYSRKMNYIELKEQIIFLFKKAGIIKDEIA